jgi:hypothetical protein
MDCKWYNHTTVPHPADIAVGGQEAVIGKTIYKYHTLQTLL